MASNLLICYPDVPYRSTILTSTTAATDFPAENTISGPRGDSYKRSTAGTTLQIDFDLGVGITAQPGFFLVARADLPGKRDIAGNPTMNLTGSASSSFTSPETKSQNLTAANCKGSRAEDQILITSYSTAYRYWRANISTVASYQIEIAKFYFGSFFDFGKEPVYPVQIQRLAKDQWNREAPYTFSLTWKGLSDTTRNAFFASLYAYRDMHPVFLYEATGGYVLRGETLLHCWIKKANVTEEQPNTNTIVVDFEECL